jgi:gamma-glutamyltranspeptidase/glutathione hydrolase
LQPGSNFAFMSSHDEDAQQFLESSSPSVRRKDFGFKFTDTAVRRLNIGIFAFASILLLTLILIPNQPLANVTSLNHFAVSTTHYLATEAAAKVLRGGGTAADAAAVAQFVLNVVQPQSTGIGGGCFILHYNASSGSVNAIDGREEAPAALEASAFCADPQCSRPVSPFFPNRCSGGLAVGVPGTVAAVDRMLKSFGSKSLRETVAPAVALARGGVPMSAHLHDKITTSIARLRWFNASAKLFLNHDLSKPVSEIGQLWFNPDLAATLERLGSYGANDFYRGQLAADIVRSASSAINPTTGTSGVLSLEDMFQYVAVERRAVKFTYEGHTIYSMPPPSSGGLILGLSLNILEAAPSFGSAPRQSASTLATLINSNNIAWADRARYIADADFFNVPLEGLLDKAYAISRSKLLPFQQALETPIPPGNPPGAAAGPSGLGDSTQGTLCAYCDLRCGLMPKLKSGTTHISITDQYGNVVSMTTTIEENLGSGVVVDGRGFLLNNEMTDFDAIPHDSAGRTVPNAATGNRKFRRTALGHDALTIGGKRPMSSMTPVIILQPDGGVVAGCMLCCHIRLGPFSHDLRSWKPRRQHNHRHGHECDHFVDQMGNVAARERGCYSGHLAQLHFPR